MNADKLRAAAPSTTPAYIEDVFSTYLYTGNGSTQTITNGIDLAGKGGLTWFKRRDTLAESHCIFDTNRGVNNVLSSNNTNAQSALANSLTAFNSNGFSVGSAGTAINSNNVTYASWTFRKQPKFFDVVTYTGNATNPRNIAHSLGSVPGCIMVKATSTTGDWNVYHRSLNGGTNPEQYELVLNTTAATAGPGNYWNTTAPTSTTFSVGGSLNTNGVTYVAYLFAHNAGGFGLSGTDNVISCGTFTSDASGNATFNLGYEPQYLMLKRTDSTSDWVLIDSMRGFNVSNSTVNLAANTAGVDAATYSRVQPTSTGVTTIAGLGNSATYIYIAIRRGPMKVPESGTSVFYPQTVSQAHSIDSTGVPFPPDLVNTFSRNGTERSVVFNQFQFVDRLRGLGTPSNFHAVANEGLGLVSSSTGAEYGRATNGTYVQLKADGQNITRSTGWDSPIYGNWIYYFMRRAPGFFDEVCYTGTGVARTVAHNLAAVPELMIVKTRSAANAWAVYAQPLGNTGLAYLNWNFAAATGQTLWDSTTPTASTFSVNATATVVNQSGTTYVAYLFATCPGVSKVGSYTGTGTTQQINCGFTTGARFVLIKRTDSTGDWYVWDSARGIVAGNDPYLLLNSTAAEVTSTDYVDTAATGFEISSTAPAAINANGGTFIFLAIA